MARLFNRTPATRCPSLFAEAYALQNALLADAYTPAGYSLDWQADARRYLGLLRQLEDGPLLNVGEPAAREFREGHALLTGWIRGRLFG